MSRHNSFSNQAVLTAEEREKASAINKLITEMRNEEELQQESDEKTVNSAIENSDIDAQDENGLTGLHYATSSGYLKTVRIFLQRGANPNISSNNGIKPIHLAMERENSKMVEIILEASRSQNFDQAKEIIEAAALPSTSINPQSQSSLKNKYIAPMVAKR